MIQINDNLNSCVPEVCPVCGAEHVRFYRRDIHGKKADGAAANANISLLMIRIQSLPI